MRWLGRMAQPLCAHVQRLRRPSGPQPSSFFVHAPRCFAAAAKKAAQFQADTATQRTPLALLVDGDQFGPKQCKLLAEYLEQSYDIRVRRIYAAPSKAEAWHGRLAEVSFDFVAVPRWTGGQKDPVDMEIAMDVIQLAMSKEVSCLAIACKDVDYARVFQRGRELGLDMLHVVPAGTNALPEVPAAIAASCSQTVVVKWKENGQACKGEIYQVTPAEQEVRDRLADLGYWDPKSELAKRNESRFFRQAIACFVHVNDISSLRSYHPFFPPRTVIAQLHEVVSQKKKWKSKPDGLLCLTGCNSRYNHPTLHMKFGNWPSVDCFEFATEHLAESVLRAFGYLDLSRNAVEQEACTLFVKQQATRRQTHERLAAVHPTDFSDLHRLFARSDLLQEWWLPRKDTQLRLDLRRLGFLDANASGERAVMRSMKRFLEDKGVEVPWLAFGLLFGVGPKNNYFPLTLRADSHGTPKTSISRGKLRLGGGIPQLVAEGPRPTQVPATYNFRVWLCLDLLHVQACPDRRKEWKESEGKYASRPCNEFRFGLWACLA